MKTGEPLGLGQIQAFLETSGETRFKVKDRGELYEWVNQVLRHHDYERLGRKDKGLVRRYLSTMTGLGRAQTARLIHTYQQGEEVKWRRYRRRRFPRRYQPSDIQMLAEVDQAHQTLSGPATQKILYREFHEFGDARFQRLAQVSVAQIYRLRASRTYRAKGLIHQPTRPTQVAIGERRKPDPRNRPGYLRVDTVHQGDLDGMKGLYHINAVDEVTQWEIVGATPHISEAWLLPVLQAILEQFPFPIRGFHSDNGSEFINHEVARLLNKLLVEQTKSRPRHSNDNGLAETKNGWVIRKHIGYGHIACEHAEAFDTFYREHFNPYLNFHRTCGVPETIIDPKGKQKRIYRWYATPWEILRQLPDLAAFLRPDVTVEQLAAQAKRCSDTQAAQAMQVAKGKLFSRLQRKRTA
jgi:transposase InsO family protein